MKSLADELREKMSRPTESTLIGPIEKSDEPGRKAKKKTDKAIESDVLKALIAYDNNNHKNMVHIRFEKQTVDLMNKFKMATGVDVTKLVAFSVRHLFETNPELKIIIKQFIQNTEI